MVDDEELYRRALERILRRTGYRVSTARNAAEALAVVDGPGVDLVLTDVRMPGLSGTELVRQVHELDPDLPCIVITGYGGPESSLEALRAGAWWYLEKPFDQDHLEVVRKLVAQAIEHRRLRTENRELRCELRGRYDFDQIIGSSPALRRVLDTVRKVAATDSTVLITGESGTGKELIARALHYNSRRADRTLVTVNCGAIPEELLESELFGHVRGAFTNAVADREGRFAAADTGTLFLDEIGDMSPTLQVKLLRVLQDGTFEPVGSSKTITVNVRVIAATNQDLEEAIREKRFREDLFYRLNVIPIEVPPLRERRSDIPLLLEHFLDPERHERNQRIRGISSDALELLCNYDWPGNVRELENLCERLAVLRPEGGVIDVGDLPPHIAASRRPRAPTPELPAGGASLADLVGDFEAGLIRQALEQTGWNKQQAAQLLRMNRTTLLEKIKKRGLAPDGD